MLIVLLLLTLLLGALVITAAWRLVHDGIGDHRPRHAAPPRPVPVAVPDSLEGVLVSQLAAGLINRAQYRREMGRIAAREDLRRPMSVPRD